MKQPPSKKMLIAGIALVTVGAVGIYFRFAPGAPLPSPPYVTLNGHTIDVEVASTSQARAAGLMFRSRLPNDHGMLFVFAKAEPRTFWMKNTLIPLDILFFDANGELVSVAADAQPCVRDPCQLYHSSGPAEYALELKAGAAKRLGVAPGDTLGLPASNQSVE